MFWGSIFYLGFTLGLLVLFGFIVWRTYGRRHKSEMEAPKHRMLDDD